jgi:hypothetical protein
LAITQGIGDDNTIALTGNNVKHTPKKIDFEGGKGKPSFFAAMQTFNGPDTATLRYRGLSARAVKVHVEEEKSRDREKQHANENVGYMALWDGCFGGPAEPP